MKNEINEFMKITSHDENAQIEILGTLDFYKKLNKEIHIKIISGENSGEFRNGFILSIDLERKRFIIIDRVLGNCNFSIFEIDKQIKPFTNKIGVEYEKKDLGHI